MRRIAFFVEGQTELYFINKLLIEIAGSKNISIRLFQIRGGSKVPKTFIFVPQPYTNPPAPTYEALIYDCGSDENVKSEILDNLVSLSSSGYSEIIGLRDLYPLLISDLPNLEAGLRFVPPRYLPLPINYEIIIAVREVESWFLSECNHYNCIDSGLNIPMISSNMGFNPRNEDMTLLSAPAATLRQIYQLVGKSYTKNKGHVERTVECLDYGNLYLNLRHRIAKLNELITKIDTFLT